jgi:regulator of protease activity HflC (stomatin/prohibitin superfamily)
MGSQISPHRVAAETAYAVTQFALFAAVLFAAVLTSSLGYLLVSSASDFKVLTGLVILLATLCAAGAFTVTRGYGVMRHFGLFALAVVALSLSGCGWTNVPPGWVGIKVDLYGKQRGVEDFPLRTGMVFYNPVTSQVYQYPTFMQQVKWTENTNEGRPVDESLTVNSIEGVPINFDCALGYHIEPDKVPALFIRFRQNVENLSDTYLRNAVRDAFSQTVSGMHVQDVYGAAKSGLEAGVRSSVSKVTASVGIDIDYVSIIGTIRLPENVQNAINLAMEANQKAIQAENMVAQKRAEAEQAVAQAQGEANAVLIKAKAEADANRIVAQSLTPELIQYNLATHWNGQLPQFTGGAIPLLPLTNLGQALQAKPQP